MLFGERAQAASRFQGYHVHEHLRRRGVPSRILAAPPFPHHDVPWPQAAHRRIAELVEGEIVVFQKIWGPNAEALREALREHGTTALYAQADLSPDNPLPLACDGVVCSSRALADWHREAGVRAWFVPDPAEVWLPPREPSEDRPLRLCWIAHRKNLETLEPLRELLAEPALAAYELVTVSNHPDADVQWSEQAARDVLAACEVGVVPVRRTPAAAAASANRVVSLMAAGLPVVADRLPAYDEVIEDGRSGFLCDDRDDWRRALLALLDPARRTEVAAAGRAAVDPACRVETTGDRWLELLREFGRAGTRPVRRTRLRAYARVHEGAAYARAGLDRYYGLPVVLGQTGRALAAAPVAPDGAATAAALVGELARPIAGRARAAFARRLRRA